MEIEYGEWTIGNTGHVGRTVVRVIDSPLGKIPAVTWEDYPEGLIPRDVRTRALISQARSTRRRDEYNARRAALSQLLFWAAVGAIQLFAIACVVVILVT